MSKFNLAAVVILAAGKGSRMESEIPKVLHQVGGKSMLELVIAAASPLNPENLIVVVGYGRGQVIEQLNRIAPNAKVVVQEEQRGTGHAVKVALTIFGEAVPCGSIVVLNGDVPLITTQTLVKLIDLHSKNCAAVTILSAVVDNLFGYGRIVRDSTSGNVVAIVEQKDADSFQCAIHEINTGIYVFDSVWLKTALCRLSQNNAQKEEYLTEVVSITLDGGGSVVAVVADDPTEILGVNDREQLANLNKLFQIR